MDNQKKIHYESDETKIYTPRYAVQVKASDSAVQSIYDQAPVRIYERPIKNGNNSSDKFSSF